MNLSLFLTLVVSCGVSVVYSQAVNSTWWPCRNLTHQHNVDLDQAAGIWYLQGVILPGGAAMSPGERICTAFRMTRTPTGMWMESRTPRPGRPARTDALHLLIEDAASDSGVWVHISESVDMSDRNVRLVVLDLSSDNRTLALSPCSRTSSSDYVAMILSRSLHFNATELSAVTDKLQDMMRPTDFIRQLNTDDCEAVHAIPDKNGHGLQW